MKRLPIGLSDYKKLIDDNYYYIDKTLFIEELWNHGGIATLIPRPRRFGKTLNMSMLRYFFEKTNSRDLQPSPNVHLFHDKKIWENSEMHDLQGKFPVIFITFKDIKQSTWKDTRSKIIAVIAAEYIRHNYLVKSDVLEDHERTFFENICAKAATTEESHNSLLKLSEFLYRYHQVKPIVLVDEYDSPIHAAYIKNYYPEAVEFIRGLFCAVFKDNSYLERGVITGILRTAKEGIFSGLNNLEVFSILDADGSGAFGFTQQEIDQMLHDYNLAHISSEFKNWYNGYLIGKTKIYNPWSSLHCVKKNGLFDQYWANTSDNALIASLIATADATFKDQCSRLLSGKPLAKKIRILDKMVLPGMTQDPDSIWSLLLFTGYVTPAGRSISTKGGYTYSLALPNTELHSLFDNLITDLFKESLAGSKIADLELVLKKADGQEFAEILSEFIENSMSCHDISSDEPEKSYHLFVLGLLVTLGHRYIIRSNRESGRGRYDIILIPRLKSLQGLVIEFKKKKKLETIQDCAKRALKQIKAKKYVAELHSLGFTKITLFGIAFHKKDVVLLQEKAALP